ncbi:MAG: YfhO family protein [Chloroflexi bacterium]|nr:YfhO family protein [Chloroflexota bacterium]
MPVRRFAIAVAEATTKDERRMTNGENEPIGGAPVPPRGPSSFVVRRSSRLKDALALAGIAVFAAVLLRKTLLQGGAMVGYDLFNFFYPAKVYAADALRRGELPLWNPYIFFGAPFLANIQMAALYPLDLLFALLEFPRAVAVSQWLHLTIGAAGMYMMCRRGWGLDTSGALIGALTFGGSGFFGAHMGHLNQVHAGVWLPWVVLCSTRLAMSEGRSAAWLVAGGAVVALMLTAGHTQEAYYSLFAAGLLALGFTAWPPARCPVRWTHLPALGAIVLNGAVLAAAQLLPAVELSRLSYRQGGLALEEALGYSVERTHILESLLPTFYSLPSQEVTGYVGVAALPLIAAAFGASTARRQVLALAALAVFAITVSLGAYTPLFGVLYEWVPLFGSFRAPGRWLLVSTFALAGLAAHGATALRRRRSAESRERVAMGYGLALAAGGALLALFIWRSEAVHAIQWLPHGRVMALWGLAALCATALGLAGIFSRLGWPRVALAAVLAIELLLAAREMEYNFPVASDVYRDQPALAAYLRDRVQPADRSGRSNERDEAPERVLSVAVEERLDPERLRRGVPGRDSDYLRYASMRESLKPNLGMVYGLATIDGYDGGLLPLRDFAQLKSLLVTGEPPVPHFTLPPQLAGRADAALLAALHVRFLVSDGRNGAPGAAWRRIDNAPGAAWLFENPSVAGRALLVDQVIVEPDAAAAVRRMAHLDLTRAAIVERPLPATPPASGAAPSAPPSTPEAQLTRFARITRYSAHEVEVETRSSMPSLLVMTDSHYPGWRAAVDGRPAPVVRANVLFRGVSVPEGTHRIRLWFDPPSVKMSFVVSAFALVANGAAAAWWRGRGRWGPLGGAGRVRRVERTGR